MSEQYWIGDFHIDLPRNQITQGEHAQTLAPKALAVLTCLAENQGKVVSQDALLEQVWKNTVVSPNSLQKCIAQLRKALGDDGTTQVTIKTHAKKGYSLERAVRWHDDTGAALLDRNPESPADEINALESSHLRTPRSLRRQLGWLITSASMVIVGVIGYSYYAPGEPSPLSFDQVRSLTATDDKEFDASYSPDGQFIVFHRYLNQQCANKLWAKHIQTQQEVLLTQDWGNYGPHSFSPDGKTLVFLATAPCDEPATQTNCFDLVNLDFETALQNPQQPGVMLRCENSDLDKPVWTSDDTIAMLKGNPWRWTLINYSISENESTDLYDPEMGTIIDFTYSARDDRIALTSFRQDGQQYIDMLNTEGRLLSSHPIALPADIPRHRPIYPNFTPKQNQLIFSTGRQLFTLSDEGEVAKISLPFADRMAQPVFHPDGEKLLMLKGPSDRDAVLQSRDQLTEQSQQAQFGQPLTYTSFQRSNLLEDDSVFQPDGELIAFVSNRTGEDQLFISDGDGTGPQQLTQLPIDSFIRGIDWAQDGQSILVSANYQLTQVSLDASQQSLPTDFPILRLFQWDSQNNSVLALARINGQITSIEYDLNTSEHSVLSDKNVLWALRSDEGQLIYKDYQGRFWQPGAVEDERIKPLDNQSGKSKSFVINGNTIYAINNDNQLWSYDLTRETYDVLGEVRSDVNALTDINQTNLIMTIQISDKKELVELSVSE